MYNRIERQGVIYVVPREPWDTGESYMKKISFLTNNLDRAASMPFKELVTWANIWSKKQCFQHTFHPDIEDAFAQHKFVDTYKTI